MSNFNFIPAQWKQLAEAPKEAEKHAYGAPKPLKPYTGVIGNFESAEYRKIQSA